MGKSDPFLSYLKTVGYSVVRLPRTNIRPLQLIVKEGNRYRQLGEATTVFGAGENIPVPGISENNQAVGVNGRKSTDLNAGVGLSLLGNIVSAIGGSKIGLDLAYKDARFVVFEFSDVLEDSIEIARLDQFLSDARVNPFSTHLANLLEADEVYVTTSTIKSTKFTVEGKRDKNVALKVDVPVIKEIVGGNVQISTESDSGTKVTFEGEVPLVFGFQAVRLFYEGGIFTSLEPEKTGQAGLESLINERRVPEDAEQSREFLRTLSPFVPLSLD